MATEEARSLLDSLMGGDRNAPLPSGAAVPLSKKQRLRQQNGQSGDGSLLLPGRRSKSCYDKDIDPLFTAWGIDVYELFVNTKSDIGTNPYVVDRGAHEEFIKLPPQEQEALGYNYQLFQKLQELVRQCDRIVTRNQDKLAQEVQRKLSQRGGQDFVETVDEAAVERLAMDLWSVEQLQITLRRQYASLSEVVAQEEEKKQALDLIFKSKQEKRLKRLEEEAMESSHEPQVTDGLTLIKQEDFPAVKQEEGTYAEVPPNMDQEKPGMKRLRGDGDDTSNIHGEEPQDETYEQTLQIDLGRITMQKQQILFDMANTISRLAPLQEAVEQQHRNLNYVKSDISTDKTVCQVSGNFMSSRDADERIAAHYAGKQYVGWKLVRDKHRQMVQKYGRYGPPPPVSGSNISSGVGADAYLDDRRGGPGGRDRRYPGSGNANNNSGSGSSYPPMRGGSNSGGRWERGVAVGGGGGGGDYPGRRGPPPPAPSRGPPGWRR